MYTFFLDIDGTIYNGSIVKDEVREAIKKAQNAGNKVFINTARHLRGIPPVIRNLGFDGIVASYGCSIFSEGDYIQRLYFPLEELERFADFAFENDVKIVLYGEDIVIGVNADGSDDKIIIKNTSELKTKYKNAKICKAAVYSRGSESVHGYFRQHSNIFVFNYKSAPERTYLEAVPFGQDKAAGIEFVEKYYGIPHENTIAVGDTIHDLEMLQYARYGVAMGSGQQQLIEKSDYVTESLENDGVAYAIDCFLNDRIHKLENNKK